LRPGLDNLIDIEKRTGEIPTEVEINKSHFMLNITKSSKRKHVIGRNSLKIKID